eukprot:Amastigsp_a175288_43.p1 type:complete len:187 gc:universal Amastigsp_a175288_43:666-106(-)
MPSTYAKITLVSVIVSFTAILFAVLCMGSFWWVVVTTPSATYNIGLKKYIVHGNNGKDERGYLKDLTALPNSALLDEGGTQVLGTGIVGVVFTLLGYLFFMIYSCRAEKAPWLLWLVVLQFLLAGLILMVGGVLYAQKLDLGNSFMGFIFTGPAIICAGVLLTYAFCAAGNDESVGDPMPKPQRLE